MPRKIDGLPVMRPKGSVRKAWAMKKRGFYYGADHDADVPILFVRKPTRREFPPGWKPVSVTVHISE